MRVVLEIVFVASALAFAAVYLPILWRRAQAASAKKKALPPPIPAAPPAARALVAVDARLHEAVEIRERIAELARKKEVGLDGGVVTDVDLLLVAMVELHALSASLGAHLEAFSDTNLARDSGLVDPAAIARQREQAAALGVRKRGLDAEIAQAVSGLRETWLGLLDALAQPGGGADLAQRTRAQVETLRVRIAAEREVRAELHEVEPA